MKRRSFFSVFAVLAGAAGVLAIGGCKKNDAAAALYPVAPAWRLKDLQGQDVTLSQFKGKVVIVDFWATWCAPCRAEMPAYVALHKQFEERGLVIVGISLDAQGPGVVQKFTDSLGITYPIVMGNDEVTEAYQVQVMPTTFVVDREGRIRHKKVGAIADQVEFEKLIASFL